jgi:hypothetical protein
MAGIPKAPKIPAAALKRRVPLGKALRTGPEVLDRITTISPEDVDAAHVAWDKWLPSRYRGLLDATHE